MRLLLGAVLLGAIALTASACGSSHPASPGLSGPKVSSSGLMQHGTVRCTATLATTAQAGHPLGVVFAFHNVSKRTVKVDLQYGGMWLLVRSLDGTTYDTRVLFENMNGPRIPPTPIASGATKTAHLAGISVRWAGPLRITPGCGLTTLHPVRVAVTSPGAPASDSAAVKDVVAASGHLLDRCRPVKSGVSVVGRLNPPSGHAPPMPARCSISLRRESGFDVAQVFVVTPPGLRGVHVNPTYEALTDTGGVAGNTEAIAWQLVVTRHGATPVDSAEVDSSLSGGGMAPSWGWTGSKWDGPGGSACGGYGSNGGVGPTVTFISVCKR